MHDHRYEDALVHSQAVCTLKDATVMAEQSQEVLQRQLAAEAAVAAQLRAQLAEALASLSEGPTVLARNTQRDSRC